MSDETAVSDSIETPKDLGADSQSLARRWKLELRLADRREANWRKRVTEIYRIYTPDIPAVNSFNILWPNTETLRHVVYNSVPTPQCRRRYDDPDPVGLKAGEILTRALSFSQDCNDFNAVCQQLVLGMLLAGRAVSWERYVPSISTTEGASAQDSSTNEENTYEQVDWEQVVSEKVNYADFRILCAAKTWESVTAIGRRHTLNREECIAKFGEEIGKAIKLSSPDLTENEQQLPESDLFKTADIWEIWDKETKRVIFITETYSKPLKVEPDPLGLEEFFPTPRPLYAIENDSTLEPSCLYTQYEQQAKELNRVSQRINKLIDGLRLRGVYDATLSEMSELMKSGDNDLIPSQNVRALIERGGLEKAIWMMPIQTAAMVLKELYMQRESTKQIIYEITGISDVMRAASDPQETLGAQELKIQHGTPRLQRLQIEVQRYIRDMLRIKADIICKKFQPETLEKMTLIPLPHQADVDQQKQQMYIQYQQQMMMAQQQGQQPPPPPQMPPDPPTWESVMQLLQNEASRSYHIDIETDSTIAATQNADLAGLGIVMKGLSEIMTGFGPAVQAGFVPINAVKELMGVFIRRARMGTAVEEAIDKIQPPQPQPDPEAAKAQAAQQQQQMQMQHEQQMAQMKTQADAQIEQVKMQSNMQAEQARAQADVVAEKGRLQADAQIDQVRTQMQIALEREKMQSQLMIDHLQRQHELQLELYKQQLEQMKHAGAMEANMQAAQLDASTKIAVAQINAQAQIPALLQAEQRADENVSNNE